MDVKNVLGNILEPDAFGGAPAHWDAAMAAMPADASGIFDADVIPARRAAADLPPERDALLCETAATVAADPALRLLAWYLHWRIFVAPEHGTIHGAPHLVQRLGDRAGLFYELLSLEFAPRLAAWHRKLGYPGSVTAETIKQIACFEGNHLRGRGMPGMYTSQFTWLAVYLVNRYVRLGRFEYMLAKHSGVNAWKHVRDGRVLALADNGTRVGDDGLCLQGEAPPETGWTVWQEETSEAVTGFPIDPSGRILRQSVRLDRAAWNPCLRKGMTVLDLHIPAGGGMDWEAVTGSFARAIEFFGRHHAEDPFAALVCHTWFLDPRLAELLPANANILRLQRSLYLTPVQGPDGLWFVFLCDAVRTDPAELPCNTALQRALANFLKTGGIWHGGSMFLLAEDMARLQEDIYLDGFRGLQAIIEDSTLKTEDEQ